MHSFSLVKINIIVTEVFLYFKGILQKINNWALKSIESPLAGIAGKNLNDKGQ
jgi:hypothetical protein